MDWQSASTAQRWRKAGEPQEWTWTAWQHQKETLWVLHVCTLLPEK